MKADSEQLLNLADRARALRITAPVLILLELIRPIAMFSHSSLLVVEPIAQVILGGERISLLKFLLSDRRHIEDLIRMLEAEKAADAGY